MFNLKGYTPSLGDKERLIVECEAIERSELGRSEDKNDNNNNTKNHEKPKFNKTKTDDKYRGDKKTSGYFCKECGNNGSHSTNKCFVLKNRARREQDKGGAKDNGKKAQAKPYSNRSFVKEVNALARKASKHDKLDLFTSAVKREEAKQAKRTKKTAKKRILEVEEDSLDSDESVHIVEAPVPRKKAKVSFASKLKEQRKETKILDEEKAFLKKVAQAEKEDKDSSSESSEED
jgi:hypothetical protein